MPFGKDLINHMNNVTVMPNSLAIYGLGQMGVAIKGPDAIIYIDACLSDIVRELFGDWWRRAYPPPMQPEEVTNATYYLCSHEHIDHLDIQTAGPAAVASPKARFITPGWCREELAKIDVGDDRLIVPTALEPMTLPGTSIRLTAIPSAHYNLDYDEEKGYRWLGFLIEWNGVTFYHSGDTIIYKGYVDTLKKLPKADLAMIATNGRDWFREDVIGAVGNLYPNELAWLAQEIGWDTVIPGHNDLFPNNAIPMGSIVEMLAHRAPRQKYKFLQPGELYYFVK
jgi:L-ascorbate metabolism protein UlaG (beta-lactamase superfamily)